MGTKILPNLVISGATVSGRVEPADGRAKFRIELLPIPEPALFPGGLHRQFISVVANATQCIDILPAGGSVVHLTERAAAAERRDTHIQSLGEPDIEFILQVTAGCDQPFLPDRSRAAGGFEAHPVRQDILAVHGTVGRRIHQPERTVMACLLAARRLAGDQIELRRIDKCQIETCSQPIGIGVRYDGFAFSHHTCIKVTQKRLKMRYKFGPRWMCENKKSL